jgi:hypothetical protein
LTTTIHHEGLRAPGSGPNDPESVTRKKMQLWDRSKFLVALVLAYLVLTWKVMADFEGVISFPEAAQQIAIAYQWIFWLLGAEIIRQLHFFVSEHWSGSNAGRTAASTTGRGSAWRGRSRSCSSSR